MFRFVPLASLFLLSCFNHIVLTPFPFGSQDVPLEEQYLNGEKASSCLPFASRPDKILVIPIHGVIGADSFLSRGGTNVPEIKETLDRSIRDGAIKGVLLLIDSPGGTVTASDQIYKLIRDYSAKTGRPVYAHIDGIGASGAYYIAMSSKSINAAPTSMIGSIGVILQSFSVKGLMDKVGIEYRSIKTGKNKDMLSPFRDLRQDERDFLQKQLTQVFERFISIVLEGRKSKLGEEKLRELADGAVYGPEQSKESGLIDSIGYLEEYLATMEKDLGLKGAVAVAYLPSGRSYNLYNIMSSHQKMDLMSLLSVPSQSGVKMYYVWDGGF